MGQLLPVYSKPSRATSFQQPPSPYYGYGNPADAAPHFQQSLNSYYDRARPANTAPSAPSSPYTAPSSTFDNQVCPICLANPKDMAFGCGHQTCCECGRALENCPICRSAIQTRIKLY
ncbi:hypothetical protein RND71_032850 [Anisodus tanguticus]|uniref:RING-type domain-containing protein n=1 Tax=Anisodus tanguticus TaxID=243964 RepID=A0AAE1V0W4_9SOLA|nr:hypothetical protein RND71_032850 [Anisodus tanguticus]